MRFRHLSLSAALTIVVFSGCSASRSKLLPAPDDLGDTRIPPRHEHEYSPSPGRSDDFREPEPRRSLQSPGEPVPAPPALGISRVKSVSWLKDMGARLNRKPVPSEPCSDETLVGKCSPIEPCVPSAECLPSGGCLTDSVDDPCSESACDRVVSRPCLVARARKSVSRIFSRRKPDQASAFCAEQPCTDESCATGYEVRPGALGSRQSAKSTRPDSRECLAEPLDSLDAELDDPGLIMPSDRKPLHVSDPVEPAFVPFEDTPAVPAPISDSTEESPPVSETPQLPFPKEQTPLTPELPDEDAPSSKVVEPPMWPRLRGNPNTSMTPVSHAVIGGRRIQASAGEQENQPLVIPRSRQ